MLVGAVNYNLETLVATADVGTSNNNQNKMGNNEINNFFGCIYSQVVTVYLSERR